MGIFLPSFFFESLDDLKNDRVIAGIRLLLTVKNIGASLDTSTKRNDWRGCILNGNLEINCARDETGICFYGYDMDDGNITIHPPATSIDEARITLLMMLGITPAELGKLLHERGEKPFDSLFRDVNLPAPFLKKMGLEVALTRIASFYDLDGFDVLFNLDSPSPITKEMWIQLIDAFDCEK